MHYSVKELNSANAKDWNALNEVNVQGSFYHTLKWKQALDRYSWTKYFLIYRNDEAAALCPMQGAKWNVKGLFPWGVLSTLDDAPLIIKYPNDALIGQEIVAKCKEILKTEKFAFASIMVSHVTKECFEYMNLNPRPLIGPAAGNMILDLQEYPPKRIWEDLLSRDDRRRVHRPIRDGWSVDEITHEDELFSFYTYYKTNIEYLGARHSDFSHFQYLTHTFMNQCPREMRVFILRRGETVAGGLLVFLYEAKKTMYYAYAALNREVSNKYSPIYTLFWHGIEKASEIGYATVAFGGTPNDSRDIHYRIKEKFGCRFEPRYRISFPRSRVLMNTVLDRLVSIS